MALFVERAKINKATDQEIEKQNLSKLDDKRYLKFQDGAVQS